MLIPTSLRDLQIQPLPKNAKLDKNTWVLKILEQFAILTLYFNSFSILISSNSLFYVRISPVIAR